MHKSGQGMCDLLADDEVRQIGLYRCATPQRRSLVPCARKVVRNAAISREIA